MCEGSDDGDSECEDDGDWYQEGNPEKDCEYVSSKPESRCDNVGEDGTDAYTSCPVSCGTCEDGGEDEPSANDAKVRGHDEDVRSEDPGVDVLDAGDEAAALDAEVVDREARHREEEERDALLRRRTHGTHTRVDERARV